MAGVQSNRRHPQRGMASGSRSRCKEPSMKYTTGTEEHIHLPLALPEEKYECRQLMFNTRTSCCCSPGGRSSGFKPGQRSGTPAALWREPHFELGIGRAPPGRLGAGRLPPALKPGQASNNPVEALIHPDFSRLHHPIPKSCHNQSSVLQLDKLLLLARGCPSQLNYPSQTSTIRKIET